MAELEKDLSQHNMEVFRDSSNPESQKGKKNSLNSRSSSSEKMIDPGHLTKTRKELESRSVPRKVLTEPKGKKTDSSDLEFEKRAISSPEKVIDLGRLTKTRKELESRSVPSEVRTELQGKITDSSDLEIDERSFPSSEEGLDPRRSTKTRSGSGSESGLRKVPTELKTIGLIQGLMITKMFEKNLVLMRRGTCSIPHFLKTLTKSMRKEVRLKMSKKETMIYSLGLRRRRNLRGRVFPSTIWNLSHVE
jgi:hypothetical protein